MSKDRLYIFDTTLRDGAQTQGVDFSVEDKEKIAQSLDNLGVDYIEGGWPGANPTDTEFFQKKHNFKNAKLTCFGMTKRAGRSAENDPGLSALLNSNTPAVCLVGKSWDFHVDIALEISNEENLENIKESAKHLCLMLNIFLMVTNQIQIMQLPVLKLPMTKVLDGLCFVTQMVELYQTKFQI
jgi:2-isopropylmalate synthase